MPTYKDSIYTDSNSDTASSDGHDLKHHHTLKDYVIACAALPIFAVINVFSVSLIQTLSDASVGFGAIIFVVFLYFYCSPLIKAYRASKAERRRKSLLKPLALSNDSFHTFEEKSYGYGINAPVPVLLRDKVSSKARDNQESRHIVPTLPAGMKRSEDILMQSTRLLTVDPPFIALRAGVLGIPLSNACRTHSGLLLQNANNHPSLSLTLMIRLMNSALLQRLGFLLSILTAFLSTNLRGRLQLLRSPSRVCLVLIPLPLCLLHNTLLAKVRSHAQVQYPYRSIRRATATRSARMKRITSPATLRLPSALSRDE